MTDLQIRKATAEDAPALCALVQRAIRTNSSAYRAMIIEMMCANFEPEKFLERMAERDVFAATLGDEFAGTVSFSLPRSKLYSLFIEPRVQRSGTGQRLVRYIERHAEALGCTFLQLSAAIPARPFYERLGYDTLKFEERVDDGATWLMRKSLRG